MGYYVKFLPHKKSLPTWKLQFISFRKEDTRSSKAKKPKHERDIPKTRWMSLGLHHTMSLEHARSRAKQLNAQAQLKRQEEQILKIERAQLEHQVKYDAFLPAMLVAEFEDRFVRKRDSQTINGLQKNTRANVAWRAAQRLIVAIGADPSEWFFHTNDFYDYFHQQKMSVRYLATVLKFANLWGFYISRRMARPFLAVPVPRGYERQRIIDANYEKGRIVARASRPLLPSHLEDAKGKIKPENFNWLFLSVWLGLRPKEVDNLKWKYLWRVEILPTGRNILWVFQTKIIALPVEDRWKPIPIIFEEQQFALRIVEAGKFKRPLRKTMGRHFDSGTTLYAGRKGFTDLMLSRGQAFENISVWMGHSTLQRTWRSYKDRKRFHLGGF